MINPSAKGDELDRLKAAFLAIISHELRTPLTEILTAASILAQGYVGELNEAQTRYLQVIEHSAEHLNQLIQDLLAFSQLEAEVVQTLREPTRLNDLAGAAVDLYHQPLAGKRIHLTSRLQPDLPPIAVDRAKILRVLSNLLSNAVSYTGAGGMIVVCTRAENGGQTFEVTDTGVGIPAQKQAHIFESFYQAEDPLTREVGGLGIGLAYARRLVEAHGGRISFESAEGQGSTFRIWLPE